MQLSARILTALAVVTLAVAYVAGAGAMPAVKAATGTIDVINVGTCYSTDTAVLDEGDCDDGDRETEGYNVAGETEAQQVDTGKMVWATYAVDPKTSAEDPRGILENSDTLKISIHDPGRDKRTGVLYPVGNSDTEFNDAWAAFIRGETKITDLALITTGATFSTGETGDQRISIPGPDTTLLLSGTGAGDNPLAPDGDVKFFGFSVDNLAAAPADVSGIDLDDNVKIDEDKSFGNAAPWMALNVNFPDDKDILVKFVYYETSDVEVLDGGLFYNDRDDDGDLVLDAGAQVINDDSTDPDFTKDEKKIDTGRALLVEARADGDNEAVELYLVETDRFSGRYEGRLRLTDANGDGSEQDFRAEENWGIQTEHGDAVTIPVLTVESGPVRIRYRDTDGDTQEIRVAIDTVPPGVLIEEPANGFSSRDPSPSVVGSISDGDSGLREDSFRIYGDNTDDQTDTKPIFDLGVMPAAGSDVSNQIPIDDDRGLVYIDPGDDSANPRTEVEVRGHYAGYVESDTFGIINQGEVYLPDDDNPTANDGDERVSALSDSFEDGAETGLFDSLLRFDFEDETENDAYNNAVDIQAVVLDRAGNLGFSDSEPTSPTFIHDYGTKVKDGRKSSKHNVLGWYSRHLYRLDEVDPFYREEQSVTGFFGLNDDDKPVASESGLVIVFDGPVDPASVSTETFNVILDGGDAATVVDVIVEDESVYLMLDAALEPDATPQVELADGEEVEDLAGNEAKAKDLNKFELSDGIAPTLTITLSGGSGLNEGDEGPGSLTRDKITIGVSSNEELQGAPKFAVVCEKLTWIDPDDENAENDVAKYVSNRSGSITNFALAEPLANELSVTCGYDQVINEGDNAGDPGQDEMDDPFTVTEIAALARPGENWEYTWTNITGATQALQNGKLVVIVSGRDRSAYKDADGDNVLNYSASTAEFTFDDDFDPPTAGGGEVIPGDGGVVSEPRPFVLIQFSETTTVDVTLFEIDDVDLTDSLEILGDNRFVYWPEPLAYGEYDVDVEANDAANNPEMFSWTFEVRARSSFVLGLLAGWNAVSFPANPQDRTLDAVFTDDQVDQVVGWDATEPVSPWRMATRVDGVWTTSDDFATLNDIQARYGYWVHSKGFITQAVKLTGKGDRRNDGPPQPESIPTEAGWNFVGVLDTDGDQTQDNAGDTLRNSELKPISAGDYLGSYVRAYTWDHTDHKWSVLRSDDDVQIGSGVWVYYSKTNNIAP